MVNPVVLIWGFQIVKLLNTKKIIVKTSKLYIFLTTIFCLSLISATYAQNDLVVAKDGSGNYTTLQAAIDAAPTNSTVPYKIFIKNGKYREKVTIPSTKPFLYLIGESINGVIISYDDYAGKPGVTEIATLTINSNDCVLMEMTVENSWGRKFDGPQALAVKGNADRLIFKNCRFISGQDTVMANGAGKRQYFKNCYIDGNTDYIYGSAIAVFDSCVVFSRDRLDGSTGGYLTAANTPIGQTYGYVFRDCLLPNNNGQTFYTLGRPWGNDVPPATSETKVVFLNCKMGSTVVPARWSPWSATTNTSLITYAEYNTTYFNGSKVDLSQRVSWSQELNATQAAPYFVNSNMFGTWDPCAVLNTVCQPLTPLLSLANVRVNRNSTGSTVRFNLCWPVNGATLQLLRSTDSLNFNNTAAVLNSITTSTDTIVSYQFTDGLPASGVSYFYRVKAAKAGMTDVLSDTIIKVNTSIPLNNDFKSIGSGGWSNNVSAVATIASGSVTTVAITSSPTGYTGVPTVTFSAAPAGGTRATGTAIVTGGVVTGVTITNPGSGYTSAPTVTFSTSGVGGNSIWQKYNSTTSTWDAVALGTAPSATNVTISSGNTVSLNTLGGATSLTIENGAVFQCDGQTRNIRMKGDVINNGVFGGTNTNFNKIYLEMDGTSGTYNIIGTGTYNFVALRPLTAIQNLVVNINANIILTNLQAWYASTSATDQGNNNVTINIGAGYTVTAAALHSTASTNTAATYGNYTYNIDGILDMSSSTSLSGLIPNATASSSKILTLNVNGILRTGTQFRTVSTTPGANESKVVLNIGASGLVDATKATTFAIVPNYFLISGNGALERSVGSSSVLFPIGTSSSSYSPLTLTNSGTVDNFTVSLKNTLSNPVANSTIIVNKQWTLTPDNTLGSDISATFGWMTIDQAASFAPTSALMVSRYDGSTWVGSNTTLGSGSGTLADPYTVTTSGLTTFGNFIVSNSTSLPLTLLSFNASLVDKKAKLYWQTSNEFNLKHFEVERSDDAITFIPIGTIISRNLTGPNSYDFTDANALGSITYYRLKSVNTDGSFSYSKTISVSSKSANKLSIYPNPSLSIVNVTHENASSDAAIEVYSIGGKKIIIYKPLEGTNQTRIDVSSLPAGSYIIKFTNQATVSTLYFNKQ